MKRQVLPIIIVDNKIHIIINPNLLVVINIKSIVMIEKQNKEVFIVKYQLPK